VPPLGVEAIGCPVIFVPGRATKARHRTNRLPRKVGHAAGAALRRTTMTHTSRQKTGQVRQPPRPGVEDQRKSHPARQASRTEPSHQKDMHDQRMLDRRQGEDESRH